MCCSAKTKYGICLLCKWANTAFWLWKAVWQKTPAFILLQGGQNICSGWSVRVPCNSMRWNVWNNDDSKYLERPVPWNRIGKWRSLDVECEPQLPCCILHRGTSRFFTNYRGLNRMWVMWYQVWLTERPMALVWTLQHLQIAVFSRPCGMLFIRLLHNWGSRLGTF